MAGRGAPEDSTVRETPPIASQRRVSVQPTSGDIRLTIFQRLLEPMTPGKLLDLGCGHGKFAQLAHRLGWQVTAVDARTVRMPMTCEIKWVEADVRDFPVDGYDCVCILGLLYHLELPDIVDLLRRCAGTPTIIDTHVAPKAELTEGGYEGKLFREIQSESPEELAATPTASWGNPTSFWPTRESLIRMLHDSGYEVILEATPSYKPGRTFYLCL